MPGPSIAMEVTAPHIKENISKLQNLCRMCGSLSHRPVLIFGPEGLQHDLAVKFCSYLPLKISETDTLPLQLCYECTNLLIQWDAAVLVAIAADKKLRALQWREQQSQHLNSDKLQEITLAPEPVEPCAPGIRESLKCSVCIKSDMTFRELVEHLKTHEMPGSVTEMHNNDSTENETKSASFTSHSGSDQLNRGCDQEQVSGDEILPPIESLGTPKTGRELRAKKRSRGESETSPQSPSRGDNASDKKNKARGRRAKPPKTGETKSVFVGSEGDSLVTSSTNNSCVSKSPDKAESEVLSRLSDSSSTNKSPSSSKDGHTDNLRRDSSGQTTPRPKVRIISAESINQTLEERAKANQIARCIESEKKQIVCRPPSKGSLQTPPAAPKLHVLLPGQTQTRIVLPGNMLKGISNLGNNPKPRFLKLGDGRIIRLIGSVNNSCGKGMKAVYTTATRQQLVPPLRKILPASVSAEHQGRKSMVSSVNPASCITTEFVSLNEPKERQIALQSLSPESIVCATSAQNSCNVNPSTSVESETSSQSSSDDKKSTNNSDSLPLKRNVMLNPSRVISFSLQPGPKNSIARYSCMDCGKRNLQQHSLYYHAQEHNVKKNGPDEELKPTPKTYFATPDKEIFTG